MAQQYQQQQFHPAFEQNITTIVQLKTSIGPKAIES
jgi:hypothetical protein